MCFDGGGFLFMIIITAVVIYYIDSHMSYYYYFYRGGGGCEWWMGEGEIVPCAINSFPAMGCLCNFFVVELTLLKIRIRSK